MPVFRVRRTVDACVIYEAQVIAQTAEEATVKAQADEGAYEWGDGDCIEYDARGFVTLTDEGREVVGTERGDL